MEDYTNKYKGRVAMRVSAALVVVGPHRDQSHFLRGEVTMKKVFFGLALIGVAGVLALPPSAASATVVVAEVSGLAFNSCTGELMFVESKIVQVTEGEGPLYEIFHQSQHGVATGLTTGQRYVFNYVGAFTSPVTNGFVTTITSHLHVTAPGDATDLRSHTTAHTTVTEAGEPVVTFQKIEFECA